MEEETEEENGKEEDRKVADESKVETSSIGQTEKKFGTLSVSEVVNHMVTVQVGPELI